jgi:hypothetical protein
MTLPQRGWTVGSSRRAGEPQAVLVVYRDDEARLPRQVEPVEVVSLGLEDHGSQRRFRNNAHQNPRDRIPEYALSKDFAIRGVWAVILFVVAAEAAFCRASHNATMDQIIAISTASPTSTNILSFHASRLIFSSPSGIVIGASPFFKNDK